MKCEAHRYRWRTVSHESQRLHCYFCRYLCIIEKWHCYPQWLCNFYTDKMFLLHSLHVCRRALVNIIPFLILLTINFTSRSVHAYIFPLVKRNIAGRVGRGGRCLLQIRGNCLIAHDFCDPNCIFQCLAMKIIQFFTESSDWPVLILGSHSKLHLCGWKCWIFFTIKHYLFFSFSQIYQNLQLLFLQRWIFITFLIRTY